VAVTGSVFVNFKTMAGLENAKTMSLDISRHMDEQKQELAAIRRYWMKAESARKDQRQQIIVLQKDLKGLTRNLEEAKSHLAKIEDLRVNDKLMLGKFIALNDKVKKIEDGRWRMEDGK
jgi:septal ring factor EnvC (AmiA/AmiB activator)